MKATGKHKVVTSGRLTGAAKAQPPRKQVTTRPVPPSLPTEPAYSLYSTDSEDHVTTLHKGLDRCAALLDGILQADKAASPAPPRAVKGGAAKSRPSLGKKAMKKLPKKTVQKNSQVNQRGPAGNTTPKTSRQFSSPAAAHSGVKLHPPRKQAYLSPLRPQTSNSVPSPQPQTSVLLSVMQSDSKSIRPPVRPPPCPECDREEEDDECEPVRDTDTHTAVRHTLTDKQTSVMKMSNTHPGQDEKTPEEKHSAETEVKAKTVEYLLGELKALFAGQGSLAEKLITLLEQTLFPPLMNVPDLSSLHSHNVQLHRQQQLKEKAERQQNTETLCNSEETALRAELTAAQSRLQELQDDLAGLRRALQDTQSQLRDREAENGTIKTDLEATRRRLQDVEREKSELALLAKQRLEEIGNLNRIIHCPDSSDCPILVGSSVSDTQQRLDPAAPPSDRIAQYLMSLGQLDPAHVQAELDKPPPSLSRDTDKRDPRPEQSCSSDEARQRGQTLGNQLRQLLNSTLSHCDAESVWSEYSARSSTTFNTRDEVAFRDGLAALDASIASLQKTIQLDLRR